MLRNSAATAVLPCCWLRLAQAPSPVAACTAHRMHPPLPTQRAMLPNSPLVEIVVGDVYQLSTLPGALGDANAIIIATGATNFLLNPAGPVS